MRSSSPPQQYLNHHHPTPSSSAFQWNLLIRSRASSSDPLSALLAFRRMLYFAVPHDRFTLSHAATACANSRHLPVGRQIHALAVKQHPSDRFLHNALLSMYLSCDRPADALALFRTLRFRNTVTWNTLVSGLSRLGHLRDARRALRSMPHRTLVSWTALIFAYARSDRPEEALRLFDAMRRDGIRPNARTLVALLSACATLGSLDLGRRIHDLASAADRGNVFVGTALIDMYSKCGSVDEAAAVFAGMQERTVATWNTMITSLGVHGRGREAVRLFEEMVARGEPDPDSVTFTGVLCACLKDGMAVEGRRYFDMMQDRYGIEPNQEHWECLLKLLEQEAREEHSKGARSVQELKGLGLLQGALQNGKD